MAKGHERFPVAEALMNGDMPLRGNRRQDA